MSNLEFVDAGAPRAAQQDLIQRFDALYLSGGDPILFRERLARSGPGDRVRAFAATGRPIIGASGGMMRLTCNVSLYRLLRASPERVIAERASFAALGLADFEVLPHLTRHDMSFLDRVALYGASTDRDVIALDDGAAIFYDGTGIPVCVGRTVCFGPEGERGSTAGGTV